MKSLCTLNGHVSIDSLYSLCNAVKSCLFPHSWWRYWVFWIEVIDLDLEPPFIQDPQIKCAVFQQHRLLPRTVKVTVLWLFKQSTKSIWNRTVDFKQEPEAEFSLVWDIQAMCGHLIEAIILYIIHEWWGHSCWGNIVYCWVCCVACAEPLCFPFTSVFDNLGIRLNSQLCFFQYDWPHL